MRERLYSEVIQADWLLQVPTAFDFLNEPLLRQVIVIKVAAHGLAIIRLNLPLERLFEIFIIYPLTVTVPFSIHVLHVAIKAAEFCQELCFIEVSLAVLNVSLDAGPFVEATICVVFGLVNSFTKSFVVLHPLFNLLLNVFFASLSCNRDNVKTLIT